MRSNIDSFIEATLGINDVGRLKRYFESFLADLGYNIVNYHVLVEGFKSVPLHKGFRLSTFPEGYIRYFIDHKCFEFDPIMDEARRRGGPILWSDIAARPNLTAEQRAMFAAAREHKVTTGAAFSIYGRPGEVAYFCVGSTEREVDFTRAQLLELQAICQQMHLRYTELSGVDGRRKLSRRETEVLELIAQGKSNPVISATLGVSPNTVDTLVRRCFDKLGVTSRVEAALAGVAMGIILP